MGERNECGGCCTEHEGCCNHDSSYHHPVSLTKPNHVEQATDLPPISRLDKDAAELFEQATEPIHLDLDGSRGGTDWHAVAKHEAERQQTTNLAPVERRCCEECDEPLVDLYPVEAIEQAEEMATLAERARIRQIIEGIDVLSSVRRAPRPARDVLDELLAAIDGGPTDA